MASRLKRLPFAILAVVVVAAMTVAWKIVLLWKETLLSDALIALIFLTAVAAFILLCDRRNRDMGRSRQRLFLLALPLANLWFVLQLLTRDSAVAE